MNVEHVDRRIEGIERALCLDDPGLERRLRRLRHRDTERAMAVIGLLVAAMALLAAGLATLSAGAWCAGVTAFLAAFALTDSWMTQPLAGGTGRREAPPRHRLRGLPSRRDPAYQRQRRGEGHGTPVR